MKFRVTRNEPLEKAMNKANLVLVEVPVNTKHGQHRSHRWKRAIDALNQLFKDLGKKANAKDITFVDKKTNKKVNKDELIEDYEKKGKQENKTLQAFVAENYKVSAKEDGKEEELTVKNKNTGDNTINTTENTKETKAPKEKIVTMASKSRYKQEKFYGTFKCGHEGEVYTGGYSDEYRQQAADDKFSHELCPHCYQKKIEEDREKAKKEAERLNLPELTGSIKQINWAISIRSEYINEMKPFIEHANNNSNDFNRLFVKIANDIQNITDSSYWIDNRKQNFPELIKNNIAMFKFDLPLVRNFTGEWTKNKISVLDPDTDLPPLNDEGATVRRKELCEGINETATNYLESLIEDIHPKYNNRESKTSYFLDELNSAVDIVKNNTDVMLWRHFKLSTRGIQDYYKYSPKMDYNENDLSNPSIKEKLDEAYLCRWNIIKKTRQAIRKSLISESQASTLTNMLETETSPEFYVNIKDLPLGEVLKACEERDNKIKEKADETLKSVKHKPFVPAKKQDGIDKLEFKGEYKKAKDFQDLKNSLSKLKGMNTKVVGRAVMDMAGIEAPLYVSRNGVSFMLGRSLAKGYCSYNPLNGTVVNICITDYPKDRAQSYKVSIHETMHGLLAQTMSGDRSFAYDLPSRYNEGIVELVASASLKEAYGKEYNTKNRRVYEDFVVDTVLKLKRMPEYKDKTLSQLGQILGDAAFNRDAKTLEKIKKHLTSTKISYKQIREFTPEQIERAAIHRYAAEHDGDVTEFEKTQLAMLVERIKNTNYTLEDAMKGGYRGLAFVLLYNILDEEDDELLGLL